ncbi:DUF4233 domain-containing protein [Actinomadura sp. WMMB 499]|uniref:DUF4233 domain-containing protein n=1 Tax=Actinomadura sp. WMMB 499 TaxID=1219491 RepID=UPI001245E008|nr:DUF4233 domain-containing protein [Actinomadura sp. WMMB 499]QFG26907.1 DUF4233 domain-containing protein [Actinomadura sp. WMMB 499]
MRDEVSGETRQSSGRPKNPVRSLLSAVLTCEALIIGLAAPVAITVMDVAGGTAALVCGGLALICLVVTGLLRFPWAVHAGSVLQVVIIATGFMVPAMFVLGAIFGALWATAIWLGRKAESAAAR